MNYKKVTEKEFLKEMEKYRILHLLGIRKAHITRDEDKNGKYVEIRFGDDITPKFITQVKDLKIKFYIRREDEC